MPRTEQDSLGTVEVPDNALYGAQTQRAVDNFKIGMRPLPAPFIHALAHIKKSAALVNMNLGLLDKAIAKGIASAADEVLADKHPEQFPVDVFQTGSGTSSNMNMNEVLATLASQLSQTSVSANDHVNMSQSSNDTIPTAIHISATLQVAQHLLPQLNHLQQTIQKKGTGLKHIVKTGRTHLMDAMPIRLDQELNAWVTQLEFAKEQVEQAVSRLLKLPQGGTAIGTGINAHADFAKNFAAQLSQQTGQPYTAASDQIAGISGQDSALALSSAMNALAVVLMKIANDLRWMNSGPLAGLGEIALTALQPGSSIMPGKVNPVIPEATAMVAAQVMGQHTTITIAAQSGNFQLNVMLPVIADNLLSQIALLGHMCQTLADKAMAGFTVIEDNIQQSLWKNPILVTALNPIIGYKKAADIAKLAYKTKRSILDVAEEETDLSRAELEKHLDPMQLTHGGIASN
ncbi:MAG: class II fumarate hydratase [Shewanellaceae bacterium]|nr:class II fumarate hydratase [Shewanellaceae bacterium]